MADLKGVLQSIYDGFNARDDSVFDRVLHDDFVDHEGFPGMPTDKTAPRTYLEMFSKAFPDFTMTVEDMMQDGDKVVGRGRMKGTHRGEFMGMPATDKAFDISFIDIVEFRDDKAIAHWGLTDAAAMMEQLGAGA